MCDSGGGSRISQTGGWATPKERRQPLFGHFSPKKLHENEELLAKGRGRPFELVFARKAKLIRELEHEFKFQNSDAFKEYVTQMKEFREKRQDFRNKDKEPQIDLYVVLQTVF